ncbi:MAG: hypothetical protein VB141_04265, partial [Burkholderia gladioli]
MPAVCICTRAFEDLSSFDLCGAMSLWSNVGFSSDQFPRGRYLTGLAIPPDARGARRKAIVPSQAMPASQASSAGQA